MGLLLQQGIDYIPAIQSEHHALQIREAMRSKNVQLLNRMEEFKAIIKEAKNLIQNIGIFPAPNFTAKWCHPHFSDRIKNFEFKKSQSKIGF